MRTVLLASLRQHTRRYVAATLAVVLAVAFLVITNAASSALRDGMVAGVDAPYAGSDVVAAEVEGDEAAALLERAQEDGAHAAVLGWTQQPVRDGKTAFGDGIDVGAISTDSSMRWQELRSGRFPSGAGEAVADLNAAKSNGVEVGDRVTVGHGSDAVDVTVVGLVDTPSLLVAAPLYLTWPDLRTWAPGMHVDSVAWRGSGSEDEQAAAITEVAPDAEVTTRDEFVEQRQTEVNNGVNYLTTALLLFWAIAMFVAVMVIANTFTIVFAQRTRDVALLRCVGATRRQVLRGIRLEALSLGLIASALGLAVGAAGGFGLVAGIEALVPQLGIGTVDLSPAWCLGGFAAGVALTVVASWVPTRQAVRVSPLAALRPTAALGRTSAGRLRIGVSVGLLVLGAILLGAAVAAESVVAMIAGCAAAFTGVVLAGPVLVPALIRLTGHLAQRLLGRTGRLAAQNAVRNPRRTAATTASLLVGVTLTTAVLTGLATSRSAIAEDMDTDHPLDVTVSAASGPGLGAELVDGVRAVDGVQEAVAVSGTRARVDHGVGAVRLVAPSEEAAAVLRAERAFARPGDQVVYLPADAFGSDVPSQVTVRVGEETRTLRVRTGVDWGGVGIVSADTLAALTDRPRTQAVWARADLDADAEDLGGDVSGVVAADGAEVTNALQDRAYVDQQLDVVTGAIVGLLGIAVVIALVGIGNTLGLSVLERGRENALLRALGLTRGQLRLALAVEAVLLAVVATLLGTALGIAFAWVGVETMVTPIVPETPLALPYGQLALVVLVASVAGLLSAVLPSRRAARTTPAAGLSVE